MKGKYATSSLHDTLMTGSRKTKNQKGGALSISSMLDLINNRKDFLVKVFATLIFQLIVTYITMIYYPLESGANPTKNEDAKTSDKKSLTPAQNKTYIFSLIGSFVIILIIALVPMPMYLKFFLFTLFSILTGIVFSFLKVISSIEIINTAIFGAMSIFGMMFLLGLTLLASGVKLGLGAGLILWFSLLILIIVGLVFMLLGTYSAVSKGIAGFSLFLFSLYVIYDTNRILQKDYYGDFITGAIDYYLDIINLILDLLQFERN
jgi:FtsH-binding integral membrane protein